MATLFDNLWVAQVDRAAVGAWGGAPTAEVGEHFWLVRGPVAAHPLVRFAMPIDRVFALTVLPDELAPFARSSGAKRAALLAIRRHGRHAVERLSPWAEQTFGEANVGIAGSPAANEAATLHVLCSDKHIFVCTRTPRLVGSPLPGGRFDVAAAGASGGGAVRGSAAAGGRSVGSDVNNSVGSGVGSSFGSSVGRSVGSSVGSSSVGNSSVGNSNVGNSSVGNSSVDNSSVDNSSVDNSSVDNSVGISSDGSLSRAGGKLAEALLFLAAHGVSAGADAHWLELGAFPGGMTAALVSGGAHVTAVDLRSCPTELVGHPRLSWHAENAESFTTAAAFDGLLCDMNGPSVPALHTFVRLARTLRPNAPFVFTLKLSRWDDLAPSLAAAIAAFAAAFLTIEHVRHFCANRREVTLLGRKQS